MQGIRTFALAGVFMFGILAAPGARGQGSQSVPPPPPPPPAAASGQNPQAALPEGRIHIEGNVVSAKLRHTVPPVYPAIARAARVQGTVVLHGVIAKDGTVKELRYVSGPPLLMKAAMDAVRQWRYAPTVVDEKPVEVDTVFQVVFAIGGSAAEGNLDRNPTLARRLQLLLPDGVPVLAASKGYKKVRDFEVALFASRGLNISFAQLKCVELGGQFCNPVTGAKAVSLEKAIRALKPEMSKDDAKKAVKTATEEAKAIR